MYYYNENNKKIRCDGSAIYKNMNIKTLTKHTSAKLVKDVEVVIFLLV